MGGKGTKKRFGDLWRHPDFLKLWAGETISFFGSKITLLALPLTAVVALDASASEMGYLGALELAPFLVVTLFAGVFVDRSRRRPILIISNLGRALLLASVPLFAALGTLSMAHLYVIGFLHGVLQVFFDLSYQSYLPFLVDREHLVEGNSKLQMSASVAEIGGPGLAGLLIELMSAPAALLMDAFTFLASVFGLAAIRKKEPLTEVERETTGLIKKIGDGFRVVLGNRYLRYCVAEAATYNFFYTMINTVFVLWVTRDLGLSAGELGVVYSAASVGALIGAMSADAVVKRIGFGVATLLSTMLACAAYLAVPLVTDSSTLSLGILMGANFLVGLGVAICNVQIVSLRQTVTPDRLLGRMNASYRFFIYGVGPLGALLAGALGDWIGLRPTIWIGAVGLQIAWLWLAISPVPRLRNLVDAEAPPRPAA